MPIVKTTQDAVLVAVVERLKAAVPELSGDSTCYVSDYPEPPAQGMSGDLVAIVSPTDGTFDVDIQEGAGDADVRERTGVVVTVFSKVKLDRYGRTESMLADPQRGMLPLKRKILAALAGKMLEVGGNGILDSHVFAQRASAPQLLRPENKLGAMSLYFSTDFAWNLDV